MIDKVCRALRNYFPIVEMREGNFKIENGKISLPFVNVGDYILIEGSKYNDGMVKYTEELTDETFTGFVSTRAVPKAFIELVAEIETYLSTDGAKRSGYTSESFGGYSYSKATGTSGTAADWQTVFRERLNDWRKL